MDPFNILTHELWENVLSNLEDPQDRLNLIWTNSALERAFQNKKVEWGFAAVLPILLRRCESEYILPGPISRREKTKKALIRCRLVSSTCERVLDRYVKSYWNENHQYQGRMCRFLLPSWYSRKGICRYFDKIKDHPYHRCPIFCRGVEFDCDFSQNPLYSTLDVILGVMERIGQHLHGILFSTNDFPDLPTLLQYLASLFQQLPNLRYFCYYSSPVEEVFLEDPDGMDVDAADEPMQPLLPDLPALPHLRHLKLENSIEPDEDDNEFGGQHINFAEYFPQLTTLSISATLWREAYNVAAGGLFPNLQVLKVTDANFQYSEEVANITINAVMFKLLKNLDAPQLKLVEVTPFYSVRYPCLRCDIKASVLEQMGTYLLSTRNPSQKWKGREEHEFIQMRVYRRNRWIQRIFKNHTVKWYNLSRMKLPPFTISKPPSTLQIHQNQSKGEGMCTIL